MAKKFKRRSRGEDDAPTRRKERATSREGRKSKRRSESSGSDTSVSTGSGWGKVATKVKMNEEASSASLNEFWISDGESAEIQILNKDPFCLDGHTINHKGKYPFEPCQLSTQRHCVLCQEGEKKTWKAVFKILDYRGSWDKDKERFKHDEPVEKLWLVGSTLAEKLKTFLDKKGKDADEIVIEITRSGKGKTTSYNFEYAWDEDAERPMKTVSWDSDTDDLEEIMAPKSDEYLTDKYL